MISFYNHPYFSEKHLLFAAFEINHSPSGIDLTHPLIKAETQHIYSVLCSHSL